MQTLCYIYLWHSDPGVIKNTYIMSLSKLRYIGKREPILRAAGFDLTERERERGRVYWHKH